MRRLFLFTLLVLGIQGMYAQVYTKGTVYDFNIGDEFHYRTSSSSVLNPPRAYINRILNRYTNNTHLFYEIGDISLTNANVVLSTRMDSIPLSELSNPIVNTSVSGVFLDTISTDSIFVDSFLCYDEYIFTNSTLDVPPGYESPVWIQKFAFGLGKVSYYWVAQYGYESEALVYYKKGTVDCGESVYMTSIQSINPSIITKLSPNPFTNQISIELGFIPEEIVQFNLYNNLGQLILAKTVKETTSSTISIPSDIPKGVYYGVVYIGNQVQTTKLVKQ
jgi:hypothetical protein